MSTPPPPPPPYGSRPDAVGPAPAPPAGGWAPTTAPGAGWQPPLAEPPRKRNMGLIAGVVGAGVLALGLLALLVVVPALRSDADPASDPVVASDDGTVREAAPGAPTRATEDGGFALGADGVVGASTAEGVRVDVYLDYMCPICRNFEEINGPGLDERRADGTVVLVIHPVSILDRMSLGTQYSTRAAAAAVYVAENAPGRFSAFSASLLENQPEEQTEGLDDARIAAIAREAGVPGEVAAAIENGTATATYGSWVEEQTAAAANDPSVASVRGFGTPTILVDGVQFAKNWQDPSVLSQAIDAARR